MATQLTAKHLRAIMPNIPQQDEIEELPLCIETAREFEITTKERFAAWIGNVAKESGELFYVREIHDGSNYEGRRDLGNIQPGDGRRFRGRGYIQITGRANYTTIAEDLDIDCVNNPELLEELPLPWTTAGYYWRFMSPRGNLNVIADRGDYETTVLGVRGGADRDRRRYYDRAMEVLPDDLDLNTHFPRLDDEKPEDEDLPHPEPEDVDDDTPDEGGKRRRTRAERREDRRERRKAIREAIRKARQRLRDGDEEPPPKPKDKDKPKRPKPEAEPEPEIEIDFSESSVAKHSAGAGPYVQAHPTHYNFQDDVKKLVLKYMNLPRFKGKIWCNTYHEHPPRGGLIDRLYDEVSFDVWDWKGRGHRLDPELGRELFEVILDDPSPPLIQWAIYNGRMWLKSRNDFVASPPGPPDSDPRHVNHIHVTFVGK
jgi:predicted chitinase